MSRLLLVVLVLGALPGCFRLSDPAYTFKELEAEAPPGPEYSLVFGSIQLSGALLGDHVDTVYFRRVGPGVEGPEYHFVSERAIFRVFRPRLMKDGDFLAVLPPGVYELDSLLSSSWIGEGARYRLTEDARVASRFHVARPGIYVMSTLTVGQAGFLSPYKISGAGKGVEPERLERLARAVKNTWWARYLTDEDEAR